MSLPISRPTAICYWLLPIIAHQNNTTLLGTKIKAAVRVCATQLSIKTPLHTDTCDLKETVENVMNLSRQMRRQCSALQYHSALEIWITTDTTGRSYEVWFHLSGLLAPSLFNHRGNSSFWSPEDTHSHFHLKCKDINIVGAAMGCTSRWHLLYPRFCKFTCLNACNIGISEDTEPGFGCLQRCRDL